MSSAMRQTIGSDATELTAHETWIHTDFEQRRMQTSAEDFRRSTELSTYGPLVRKGRVTPKTPIKEDWSKAATKGSQLVQLYNMRRAQTEATLGPKMGFADPQVRLTRSKP